MKKILNHVDGIVPEMGAGIVITHPELCWNDRYHFLRKTCLDPDKVTLICGGGSGHEPAHAGYVGEGMLDAAVCGDVFASPSQIQVYQAIRECAGKKGVLLLIKNYSGDIMNFQNAAFLAQMDGIQAEYVKICDDIAVEDSLYTVGRRGVAGTVLVHKVAGAAAQAGKDLPEVKRLAQKAADHVKTIGFALNPCTVPAKGTPTFVLEDDELEYGIGIHGEPGIRREKSVFADELSAQMIPALASALSLQAGDEAVLLVNGFGGTPLMELYVLANSAMGQLEASGVRVCRVFTGNYMTSLEMQGASLSVMKLDSELKTYLDAPCTAPAFRVDGPVPAPVRPVPQAGKPHPAPEPCAPQLPLRIDARITKEQMTALVAHMADIIIENERPFCELDSHAGDGDFGMSVAKGFRALKAEWGDVIQADSIGAFLDACSFIIMEHCGGASGPIWGFAFKYAAKSAAGKTELELEDFAAMLQAAVRGIQETGRRSFGRGAVVGDKTLIDALVPCADAWSRAAESGAAFPETFRAAAQAAVEGAESTKSIVARMGRAGVVGKRSLGYPDAGAHALGVIFTQLADSIV